MDPRIRGDSISGRRGPRPDQAEHAGVAVHERRALHGRDLAGAEHAGDRDVDHAPQRARIVAAHAEHVAAAARRRRRAARRRAAGAPASDGGEPLLELVGGGLAVAQVKLHDRVRRDARADPERAAVRIEAEDVAHQEVAGADRLARARQREPDAERVAEARAVGLVERREERRRGAPSGGGRRAR